MTPAIMVLAIMRLTTLITDDEITRPLRDLFKRKAFAGSRAADWVDAGINCPRCVSVWAAGGVIIASRVRLGAFLVNVLAGSQVTIVALGLLEKTED